MPTTAQASYANSGCQSANTYINLAIPFIQEINTKVSARLLYLQLFQISYSSTYNYLYNEITSISNKINSTYNLLYSNSSDIAKCSSVRFDLIDFVDFIGDTTEYDARIVVIFSAFIGVFGYVMLYCFLVLLNSFSAKDYENEYEDYDNEYVNSKKKYRNINYNNNVKPIKKESINSDEEEEEDEDDDYKKKLNNKNSEKKGNIPVKTGQKVEMSYLSKNNDDSDSS